MSLIRQANLQDIPKIGNLELRVFGAGGHTAVSLRQLYDLFPSLLIVVESETIQNEVLGYSAGAISQSRGVGWILSLGVDPDHRQLGLGRLLAGEIINRLTEKGIREMFLTVSPNNNAAKSLYVELGFMENGTMDDYYFDGTPRILMSRASTSS